MTLPDATGPSPKFDPASLDLVGASLVVAEFNALREEILERTRRHGQIMTLAIVALGTLLAAGIQSGNAALIFIYPLLATGLAQLWVAEDHGIQVVGYYIRHSIESNPTVSNFMGWEEFVQNLLGFKEWFRNAIRFLFLASELAAVILAVSISKDIKRTFMFLVSTPDPHSWLSHLALWSTDLTFLVLALLGMIITVWAFWSPSEPDEIIERYRQRAVKRTKRSEPTQSKVAK